MKLTFRNIVTLQFIFSGLVLVLLSRRWVSAEYVESGFPTVNLDLSANELMPALSGLAVAAIASTLGAIATRGIARRLVGAIIAAIGLGIVFVTVNIIQSPEQLLDAKFAEAIGRNVSGWSQEISNLPWLVVVIGLLIATCGALIAVRNFDSQLSGRYERVQKNVPNLTPWQSLDKGIDPTIERENR